MLTFLREFVRDPVEIGAVAPSGKQLAALTVEAADLQPHHNVVELGAGTGPMTEQILTTRGDATGELLVLEPNAALAHSLRERFPAAAISEEFAQKLPELTAEWSPRPRPVHRVVSSLPWAIWNDELQSEVFDAIDAVLADDGKMVTFSYVHAQPLPAAKRLRAALDSRFARITKTRIAWMNVPPAFVFVCEEPKR